MLLKILPSVHIYSRIISGCRISLGRQSPPHAAWFLSCWTALCIASSGSPTVLMQQIWEILRVSHLVLTCKVRHWGPNLQWHLCGWTAICGWSPTEVNGALHRPLASSAQISLQDWVLSAEFFHQRLARNLWLNQQEFCAGMICAEFGSKTASSI